jgi:putative tryptophan/tyrosine transport system substrate-binding protein
MRPRVFVILLDGVAAWPLSVLAQPRGRNPVIGYLIPANPEPVFGYFKEGLQKLGYVEGRNIHIEFRSAEGKSERLAGLAAELVRLKVDILVAAQTPAITAAKQATSQIPIVMAGAGDPVGTGLIASLARPGRNITGTSSTTAEVGGKLLELIREVLPSAKRVAVLVNATDPFGKPFLEQLQSAARTIKLEILPTMIRETSELSAAFPDMVKLRTDVVIVQPSLPRKAAAELSLKHRLPAVAPSGAFPDEGGLMSYSATVSDVHRETAVYVDKILKGAKPADLPVQQPTKFELVVNLKTAKALGITIPQSLLVRADEVIQ